MNLKPGTVVVLEGVDKSGKSTQLDRLAAHCPDDLLLHQPSGGSPVGFWVYAMTEHLQMHPLTRQFLHLASHAEMYDREIVPALKDRGVILDRCWWSTMAYGWYAGGLKYLVDEQDFERMCRLPTQGISFDLVFLFLHPHVHDPLNSEKLAEGFAEIAAASETDVVEVPIDTEENTEAFIMKTLEERGLLVEYR